MTPIRVLLVDDHAVLRAGLRAMLDAEPDVRVVGEAATGEEGVSRAEALRPDVVVMDLAMPGAGGLEATRRIALGESGARVLVLSSQPGAEYRVPVLAAGATGFVAKRDADLHLADAVRTVARGGLFPPGAPRVGPGAA